MCVYILYIIDTERTDINDFLKNTEFEKNTPGT